VPHLVSTSLSTLQDTHRCLFLSALHFLRCKILIGASPGQHLTFYAGRSFKVPLLISTSLAVLQDTYKCNSLSVVHSVCSSILTGVWLWAIHCVPCKIVTKAFRARVFVFYFQDTWTKYIALREMWVILQSVVSISTRLRVGQSGLRILVGERDFFSPKTSTLALRSTHFPTKWIQGLKRPGCAGDHSPSPAAKVKNSATKNWHACQKRIT
jgi:hypothetical protein